MDITASILADTGEVLFKYRRVARLERAEGRKGGYGFAARIPLSEVPPGSWCCAWKGARGWATTSAPRARSSSGWCRRCAARPSESGRRRAGRLILQTTPPMRTIARGDQSGVETERHAVARTDAESTALWRQHAPAGPAPPVDFSKETVVGVFLGSRSTAGYGRDRQRRDRPGHAPRPLSPACATQRDHREIITTPFHIIAVPKTSAEVKFERIP